MTSKSIVMREELLHYLTFTEIAALSMLSKAINNVVDPNWKYIATADQGRKIGWFEKSVIKHTIIKATYGHADVTD